MAVAKRDANRVPTLIGVSSADGVTPTLAEIDPATGELLVKPASLTSSSVVTVTGGAGQTSDVKVTLDGESVSTSSLTTWVTTAVTLTTANTTYLLPGTEQTGRKTLVVYNISDTAVYIGTSTVTTTTGILLPAGGTMTLDAASGVYAVCGTNSKIVNCLEGK